MRDETVRAAIRLYDRFTHERLDRRRFMADLTRLAGSAAAASMLLASIEARAAAAPQVAPDDPRLRTATTGLLGIEGHPLYSAYTAELAEPGQRPSVLVVHENRGLNEHIRDVTRRLALAGYHAVAPDFLSPSGGTPADEDAAREAIGALDMPAAIAAGVAMLRLLRGRQGGSGKVGTIGFCWGGAMVNWLAVAAGDALDAGVDFYGPAPPPAEARRVSAPLLIHLAERDERVNGTALPWVLALRQAGRDVRAINYHGVDHAFHNDTSQARYDRTAADRAWAETLRFFERQLGGRANLG